VVTQELNSRMPIPISSRYPERPGRADIVLKSRETELSD